ncbi:MAG: helix-turn-helix domain-containing protein [Clostridiales bacterium]|nr:helix-turn-helix domain-containing protein [Clostridiales bacterium]
MNIAPVTMSMQEAANYIGISYEMLRQMALRKEIPCICCGNRKLFRQATIDAWMTEQEKSKDNIDDSYGKLRKIY